MRRDDRRILVVGTTADYIDWIRRRRPGQALFLTDPAVRREAREAPPPPEEELLCDLTEADRVAAALAGHLERRGATLGGVACFDCESMPLAAHLAERYALPYPSRAAVANCRDKYRSKVLWRQARLATPAVRRVSSAETAIAFLGETGGPIVLKPLGGSGSEFVFRCDDPDDCERHFKTIAEGLARRGNDRLYRTAVDISPPILAEALVAGEEFSCDFLLAHDRVTVIRLTRKVRFDQDPFGTAKAYVLPGAWPDALPDGVFERLLYRAARALGLERAVCMLDFFIVGGEPVLLEMAPRPGGDCLPALLRRGLGLDMLTFMLDFARGLPLDRPLPRAGAPLVGLRLHAGQAGTLVRIDDRRLRADPRVREVHLARGPGHRILRPPQDYDAWLLGHAIFSPDPDRGVAEQCRELAECLSIEVAGHDDTE